jgi:5-methylcytosine-specific restriction protein A
MGRLKSIAPQLQSLAPKLGGAPAISIDLQRAVIAPWRAWYGTQRWRVLRREVFLRDGYICQRTGVLAAGQYPAPDSPVANHKVPHRGDPALFWDINNIETVTKLVHDSLIQIEEQSMPKGVWS